MSATASLPVRSCDSPELHRVKFGVVAAGALLWRRRRGAIEVLLIHRPKYDDFSFPKGKLDADESVAECAVREVREEVGLSIALGRPLPAVTYEVPKGTKVVFYWAAEVTSEAVPDGGEVDSVHWLGIEKARKKLTNSVDREPLDALAAFAAEGTLQTRAFVLARHAKSKPRAGWTRAEGERPLAASGRRQAGALARMLGAWRPERVISSPWIRCLQTVQPYAARREVQVKAVSAFTEHSATRHPGKTERAFAKQWARERTVLLCTHRPVLPVLFDFLRRRATPSAAAAIPADDPYLGPGAVLVVHRAPERPDTVLSVEIHQPFDD